MSPQVDSSEDSAAMQTPTRETGSMGASLETFEVPPKQQQGAEDKISKESTTKNDSSSITSVRRPWWKRGGMHRNVTGMALNIFVPFFFMASHIPDSPVAGNFSLRAIFYAAILSAIASSYLGGMKTSYCIVVLPTMFMSFLLCYWALPTVSETPPTLVLIAAHLVAVFKVGVCMSICLHRYAAHAAFSCGPILRFLYFIGGCLANQGGPIWWATIHRAHHKYCDTEGDPHSPLISGVERAFAFFFYKARVVDEFVPRHLDNEFLWFLDTWAFVVHSAELYLAYVVGGLPALYVAWQSAFLNQAVTLWFNVINHPIPEDHDVKTSTQASKDDMRKVCVASDCIPTWFPGCFLPPGGHMAGGFLPFHILNTYYFFLIRFVYEGYHKHHHDHSRLAERAPFDWTYLVFVYPLEKSGLVWNVHHYPKEVKKD